MHKYSNDLSSSTLFFRALGVPFVWEAPSVPVSGSVDEKAKPADDPARAHRLVAYSSTRYPEMPNVDNEYLGAKKIGDSLIGEVDEVNGAGAEELPEFNATRYELLQIAKHWTRVALEIEYEWFLFDREDRCNRRRQVFAWRRVERIATLVGEEAVDRVVEEVKEVFAEEENPEYWHAFMHGTEEERRRVQWLTRDSWPGEYASASGADFDDVSDIEF